jgi:hypothetical protein
MRRRKALWFLLAGIGSLVVFWIVGLPIIMPGSIRRREDRRLCADNLKSVWYGFRNYYELTGRYPHPNELRLMDQDVVALQFICPSKGRSSADWSNVTELTSYIINDGWPGLQADPGQEFPLMYDRQLANHAGDGINIVTVGGRVFWDSRGDWIRQFAREHPDWHIPMPEDMDSAPGSLGSNLRMTNEDFKRN